MSNTPAKNGRIVRELVLANHILAFENVLDAYGHVSVRNPENPASFLMSRSRSPEIVDPDDIFVDAAAKYKAIDRAFPAQEMISPLALGAKR